jgi:glucose-6-phosphate 1-dehydrogenase
MTVPNPLNDPLRFEWHVPPCTVVIFGANGDLTRRKLLPALYRLAYEKRLGSSFSIVGNSRTPMPDDAFREKMRESVEKFLEASPFDRDLWTGFAQNIHYVDGDVADPAMYHAIAQRIDHPNVLFYLSTQPSHYATVVEGIGAAGLNRGGGWRRIVVEKPFGRDLASAQALDERIHRVFDESEVYRIDHYLGKETVQNILAFRFSNGIFEPLWNRRYVNHVQITAAESIGVEGRGAYYQEAGVVRDMIQNHLLQVLATVAMEPPAVFEANAVRDERAKALKSIKIPRETEIDQMAVPGQYGRGRIGGEEVPGFREEEGVNRSAQTETYAGVTFFLDNWRWAGIPFYVRSGKRLPRRVTDIAIQFNAAPLSLFASSDGSTVQPNLLILRIQPEEGISLRFLSKQPGSGMQLRSVSMDFNYGSSFGTRTPSAYETLLLDALEGDSTLYTRQDMVEASWRVVEPILNAWSGREFDFPNYEAGTWGPAASNEMLARRGHHWRNS